MKVNNGTVEMDQNDLESMKKRFYVSMHTDYYANLIGTYAPDGTLCGFRNWLDCLNFYFGNEPVAIESEQHLESCLAMMDAIVKFNSFRPD